MGITKKLLKSQDVWILTKLEKLVRNVNNLLNECRFHEDCHVIEDFIINSLSQTYVPLIRYDLWSDDLENRERRFTVYKILSCCLFALDLALHPICPYITEFLYQSNFKRVESILFDRSLDIEVLKKVSNDKVEFAFDKIKEISSMSFSLRNKLKLKRRWPLESIFVFSQDIDFLEIDGMLGLLKDQMNIEKIIVKKIRWTNNAAKLLDLLKNNAPVIPNLTVNRKTVAKEVKGDITLLIEKFGQLDKKFVLDQLQGPGTLDLEYSKGKSIRLTLDDINIDFDTINGYSAIERDNVILFLNIHRNDELILKGMVKDLARNIQQLRKELGYSPTKILDTAYISNFSGEEVKKIQKFEEDLRNLVRVNRIVFRDTILDSNLKPKQIEIDGKEISIYIH